MKRARTGASDADDVALETFAAWCRERGVRVNEDAIEIRALETTGGGRKHYAVFARRDVRADETVFEIPKSCVLSAVNSRAVGEAVVRARLGGGLALNATAACELLGRGRAGSFWAGYGAILPLEGERTLPMFWSEEERRALGGTELAAHLDEDDAAFAEDFEECATSLGKELCEEMGFTLETFKAAASIAASRAFYLGGKYGECLVPCADLFNHRTGTNSVAVFGVEDSDDENCDDDDDDGDKDDTLVIKTVVNVKAGEELFNTFGEQSNTSLLHKYGFCETHNVDTAVVTLDVSLFVDVYGEKIMQAVYDSIKKTVKKAPFLEFFEDDKYYEVTSNEGIEAEFFDVARAVAKTGLLTRVISAASEIDAVKSITKSIILARLKRYGDLSDLDADLHEDNASGSDQPPAGGGVIGARAARLVRKQEIDLLLMAYSQCGEKK